MTNLTHPGYDGRLQMMIPFDAPKNTCRSKWDVDRMETRGESLKIEIEWRECCNKSEAAQAGEGKEKPIGFSEVWKNYISIF
jgi:hypothetical protein